MLEVQAIQPSCYQGTGFFTASIPARFLEGSDGVTRLYYCDEVVAIARGRVEVVRCRFIEVEWLEWSVECLEWQRPSVFKLLQGASLQQLFGPRYVIVRGASSPLYAPLPCVRHVGVVELVSSHKSLTGQEFFDLVHRAHGSTPAHV